MKIWFDTEFYEDGRTIELISIGMIREDGVEFYAETLASRALCYGNRWLADNVLPHLQLDALQWKMREEIARDLLAFAGDAPEFWAYYADYDWVALCQLYGRMIDLPKGWPKYCRDLKQRAEAYGVKLPAQEGVEHHALADARWTKSAYLWLDAFVMEHDVGYR